MARMLSFDVAWDIWKMNSVLEENDIQGAVDFDELDKLEVQILSHIPLTVLDCVRMMCVCRANFAGGGRVDQTDLAAMDRISEFLAASISPSLNPGLGSVAATAA